jgi:LmbE family N-acetylglucosaminyl deacetylase/glycosyltransferase involved in cell wall biosynthesis
VDVLFLPAGAAAAAPGEDAADHSRRRRAEAEGAARVLGLRELVHLGLPDGALASRLEEAAAAVGREIAGRRPELVLAPSPLEASADHRAAFAALHRALAPVRGEGDELGRAASRLRVLAYEVNRPLYPDLLVDVTAELPKLGEAMACYASQLERHRYLEARLGLLSWRSLSLPPEVRAAEAYRRLAPPDFQTRSAAQLIRHLGGEPERFELREGPPVSVVVRTRDRPELLRQALGSLALGGYRRAQVVLVNDGGAPPAVPADYPLPVVRLDLPGNRGRAAAAQAGVEAATGAYVAFLDDDDLAAPEHLATLAGLVGGAGVRVAYTDAAVGVYELDAHEGWRCVERRLPYSRDFDADLLLLDNYIPFNTLLIERSLFSQVGPFDPAFPFFEDWDFLIRLAAVAPFHHLPQVTCEYRHFRGGGHHVLGAAPRGRADFLEMKARVLAKHATRLTPELLAAAIDRLRSELVELGEEKAGARREEWQAREEAAELLRQQADLERRYHRLNGEIQSLRGDQARLLAELDRTGVELKRLHGEEQRLTRDLSAQTDLVARLYAEIERLMARLEAMEGTRAWRFHQWFQRRLRRGRGISSS